jgi:hypothetical protein
MIIQAAERNAAAENSIGPFYTDTRIAQLKKTGPL